MSEPVDPSAPNPYASTGLQFETAELSTPVAIACGECRREIHDRYFELAGRTICTECSGQLADGSFLKAMLFGAGAALVGALVWYAIEVFANFRLSLVALGIGWAVGKAIRRGAGNSAGAAYQVLSVMLTYGAIALSQFPGSGDIDDLGLRVRLAVAAPFTMSATPIGWFIVGYGLWNGWKFAAPEGLAMTGPYPVVKPVG